MSALPLVGWDRLRHGGLLLDAPRLGEVARFAPAPLNAWQERELRRRAAQLDSDGGVAADFVAFVLEELCGFSPAKGSWLRGNAVPAEWSRRAVTGETVRPRHLWKTPAGALLPVFFEKERKVGTGRGRRTVSQVLQWLRGGREQLALLTNGRQWRLIFAGLDFDAWCEGELDLWFEEGALSPQLDALRNLLAPAVWEPTEKGSPAPLLQAILDSRKGQAELSAVLGERVREAVEILVQAHGEVLKERCSDVPPAEIYRAAVRVVMRLVVVLFAESRELLPRDNVTYHGSYGVTGLLEALEKLAARTGRHLKQSWSAWPRLLALFRLVHQGSHHPELAVPAYGGELFAPAPVDGAEAGDGLTRALAVFESACFEQDLLSDRDVLRMLGLITRTQVRLRQGRASIAVQMPVDFSDLSSEYIGILYEGLLDFELRTVPAGDPVIFLAVGNQPALPLSRLEAMDDAALKSLLEAMKDKSRAPDEEAEGSAEEAPESEEGAEPGEAQEAEDEEEPEESEALEGETEVQEGTDLDPRHTTRTRAEAWARRAAVAGSLVRRPRGRQTPERLANFETSLARKARQLVTRVVLPGEWYLVRWGGTRKGSGTFYTRPGLAVPTVQRTLRPLAYDPPAAADGTPDRFALAPLWVPKTPEAILALQVCDPACGSGSFPVAALRFLTDALYASLHHHGRIRDDGDRSVVALLGGEKPEHLATDLLPCRPDDDTFEPRLKALLRRYVVERCLYGVDIDPLAVELCRLTLWVETMDRDLPFSFLDHKIKCGNSLVGAWFDTAAHYPAMAWMREAGDEKHTRGVHSTAGERAGKLKAFKEKEVKPALVHFLSGAKLFNEDQQASALATHETALNRLQQLHELPVHDAAERARRYRDGILGDPALARLRDAFDLWCACWFWPADEVEQAPLPTDLAAPRPETLARSQQLARAKRFFHWELEFPEVFTREKRGFDAILGNPPWDVAKPNSKEFFSNLDPLYRAYGKQEALRRQAELFADEAIERAWLDYSADFRALSNFMGSAARPFGDPAEAATNAERFSLTKSSVKNLNLHASWRVARAKSTGFADTAHPFRHQGSGDVNLYKLLLEQAHALLRVGGRLGFLVPSGLYSDHGSQALRRLFLDLCRWEWIFGFENRDGIFAIHRSYKFNPVIIEKGGATVAIRTAFMRRKLEDWARAEELATDYPRERVAQFSPRSVAILEIQSKRDLEILEKIYANSVLLGDDGPDGWGITYAREFDMTNDSELFPPRPWWESEGYRPDEYSRWLKGRWRPRTADSSAPSEIRRADLPPGVILSREGTEWIHEGEIEGTAVPLYEGRMIGQFDFSKKAWISGKGRKAEWAEIEWSKKSLQPQYLVAAIRLLSARGTYSRRGASSARSEAWIHGHRICYERPLNVLQPSKRRSMWQCCARPTSLEIARASAWSARPPELIRIRFLRATPLDRNQPELLRHRRSAPR